MIEREKRNYYCRTLNIMDAFWTSHFVLWPWWSTIGVYGEEPLSNTLVWLIWLIIIMFSHLA